ncbi:FHA domain-containing protein FhaB/FipA [Corynebacterium epidermidicanis]|uniref:FHA domain-containing protein n=1 Tax=Corynebacterium epidermidicanis TaxID=1050174 RepID=A0A0G3GLA5_9CORY|nr:FHA domain-containing protein [Corynebacterium epidermidicanis]AKK01939.1 FHA domain-containing protein [Corynebacterium epidermidicanis]
MILLAFRIGLLVLLWFFIFMAFRALRRDTAAVAGPAASAPRAAIPRAHPGKSRGKGAPRIIKIVDGPLTGSHMDISTLQEFTLGRSQDAEFVLGDDYASGRHARITRRGNDWFVEDLDSRNGTYVNQTRIDQPERITLDSDITIGRTTVRLEP